MIIKTKSLSLAGSAPLFFNLKAALSGRINLIQIKMKN
jgi:hypothetical protein